ncbi:hypothetical protein GCM10028807_13300 [Spirosoma daeguense]
MKAHFHFLILNVYSMKNLHTVSLLGVIVAMSLLGSCKKDNLLEVSIPEINTSPTTSGVQGNVFEPALVEATDDRIGLPKVPMGSAIRKFADQLGKPRTFAVGSLGNVFVTYLVQRAQLHSYKTLMRLLKSFSAFWLQSDTCTF